MINKVRLSEAAVSALLLIAGSLFLIYTLVGPGLPAVRNHPHYETVILFAGVAVLLAFTIQEVSRRYLP